MRGCNFLASFELIFKRDRAASLTLEETLKAREPAWLLGLRAFCLVSQKARQTIF